jgi:transposase InsO family protein
MIYPVVRELAEDPARSVPVAVACRVLKVSTSGYYDWRERLPSARAQQDMALLETIRAIHHLPSRGTYGSPRVHAELRLGLGIRCGRKRVERLMRTAGLTGVTRRRTRGITRRAAGAEPRPDLVTRVFTVTSPDRLWCADITEHPTGEGTVYAAVVLDAYSRRVLGLAIADHLRTELVIDALQMAIWRRGGHAAGCVHHCDHGCQYTSWAFGTRLREAGLLASLGSVGDALDNALDNALVESFFATLQTELLDRRDWTTRGELAAAIFEYVECFYNPTRRHSSLNYLSPVDYEHRHSAGPTGQAA